MHIKCKFGLFVLGMPWMVGGMPRIFTLDDTGFFGTWMTRFSAELLGKRLLRIPCRTRSAKSSGINLCEICAKQPAWKNSPTTPNISHRNMSNRKSPPGILRLIPSLLFPISHSACHAAAGQNRHTWPNSSGRNNKE